MTEPLKNEPLAPCPFCGGKAEYDNDVGPRDDYYVEFIKCVDCGASTPRTRNRDLRAIWNTRTVTKLTEKSDIKDKELSKSYLTSGGHIENTDAYKMGWNACLIEIENTRTAGLVPLNETEVLKLIEETKWVAAKEQFDIQSFINRDLLLAKAIVAKFATPKLSEEEMALIIETTKITIGTRQGYLSGGQGLIIAKAIHERMK